MPFERDKQYRTFGGFDVTIVCTDCPGPAPIIGYWGIEEEGVPAVSHYTADGKWFSSTGFRLQSLDLIPNWKEENGVEP